MTGRLLHIHVAGDHRAPMVELDEIQAVEGMGLAGDRNFGTPRQVTIVTTAELSAAGIELGIPIPPGATRRNLTVELPSLPRDTGARIRVGEVVLEVRRDCTPCELMETEVGPGARRALQGRSGVSAHVVVGGRLRPGDRVTVEQPSS